MGFFGNMTLRRKLIIYLLLILLAGAASFLMGDPVAAELQGTEWTLLALRGEAPLAARGTLTLHILEERIEGGAGCNHFFAEEGLMMKRGRFGFHEMARTTAGCRPEEILEQERRYLQALRQAERYEAADGRLRFYDGEGELILLFARAAKQIAWWSATLAKACRWPALAWG